MSTNYLAQFSANLSTISAVNINYSTLIGSTIIASSITTNSTINVSSITSRTINYSTLSGSTLIGQTVNYSTLSGSTINANTISSASIITTSSILANGNVGIGTNALTKLSVLLDGLGINTTGGWSASSYAIFGPGVGSANGSAVGITYNTTNDYGAIMSMAPNTAWKDMYYMAKTHSFNSNGATIAMTIASTGSVGIGTNSPYSLMHITGSSTGTISLLIANTNTAVNSSAALNFGLWPVSGSGTSTSSPAAQINAICQSNSTGQTDLAFSTYTGNLVAPTTYTLVERMRITATGNVGIGTNSPNATLHVNGNTIP